MLSLASLSASSGAGGLVRQHGASANPLFGHAAVALMFFGDRWRREAPGIGPCLFLQCRWLQLWRFLHQYNVLLPRSPTRARIRHGPMFIVWNGNSFTAVQNIIGLGGIPQFHPKVDCRTFGTADETFADTGIHAHCRWHIQSSYAFCLRKHAHWKF